MKASKIIGIPVKMEKYFGKGTMLHPAHDEIEDLIRLIPQGKVTTINHIASHLAMVHGTDVTCPLRTGNAIKTIANRYDQGEVDHAIPFWRVLRSDKLMIKSKNFEEWATLIEEEGFNLELTKNGNIKIKVNDGSLYSF